MEWNKPDTKKDTSLYEGSLSHSFLANRWGNNTNNGRFFLDSKITADGDCSHKIKRHLLLEEKL